MDWCRMACDRGPFVRAFPPLPGGWCRIPASDALPAFLVAAISLPARRRGGEEALAGALSVFSLPGVPILRAMRRMNAQQPVGTVSK